MYATYLYAPDTSVNNPPRKVDVDDQLLVLLIKDRKYWKIGIRKVSIMSFLPAIFGNMLNEVPLHVEQAYGYNWYAKIASFLKIITGKNPQTAGVYRQGLEKLSLNPSKGNRLVGVFWVVAWIPSVLAAVHIMVKRLDYTIVKVQVGSILCCVC